MTLDGREVKLTAKEFLLLRYLLQHRGRVLSRDLLLADVWGYSYAGGARMRGRAHPPASREAAAAGGIPGHGQTVRLQAGLAAFRQTKYQRNIYELEPKCGRRSVVTWLRWTD